MISEFQKTLCTPQEPGNGQGKSPQTPCQPGHNLFQLLRSARCYRALYVKTARDQKGSFHRLSHSCPRAIDTFLLLILYMLDILILNHNAPIQRAVLDYACTVHLNYTRNSIGASTHTCILHFVFFMSFLYCLLLSLFYCLYLLYCRTYSALSLRATNDWKQIPCYVFVYLASKMSLLFDKCRGFSKFFLQLHNVFNNYVGLCQQTTSKTVVENKSNSKCFTKIVIYNLDLLRLDNIYDFVSVFHRK